MQDNLDWRQIFRVEGEKKKKGLSSADLELVLESLDLSWVNALVLSLMTTVNGGSVLFLLKLC